MRLREEIGERDLDLRLENRLADFVGDGVDAAIRYGAGDWPGYRVATLFKVRLFPVCSPRFLETHRLARLDDLHHVPLLRHTHPLWSWPAWFRALELAPPADRGMMFDDSSFMLEAAAQSLGVALARSSLVQADLATGRLVRPLPDEVESNWGYFFVWRADAPKLSRILQLRDWLLAEAAFEKDEA
jgi:LysR family glycine cleavage system transcriptional activator